MSYLLKTEQTKSVTPSMYPRGMINAVSSNSFLPLCSLALKNEKYEAQQSCLAYSEVTN